MGDAVPLRSCSHAVSAPWGQWVVWWSSPSTAASGVPSGMAVPLRNCPTQRIVEELCKPAPHRTAIGGESSTDRRYDTLMIHVPAGHWMDTPALLAPILLAPPVTGCTPKTRLLAVTNSAPAGGGPLPGPKARGTGLPMSDVELSQGLEGRMREVGTCWGVAMGLKSAVSGTGPGTGAHTIWS